MNILPLIVPVIFLALSCHQTQHEATILGIEKPADTDSRHSTAVRPATGFPPRLMNAAEIASLADGVAFEQFSFSTLKKDISPQAQSWLKAIAGGHFTIAGDMEKWQCCCDRGDTILPEQQLISIAQSAHIFMMAYRTGGFAVINHLLIIRHKEIAAPIYCFPEVKAQPLNSLDGMLHALKTAK